ncbi:MAG: glycosyltransferase [Phycisphaerae bacterium]
MPTVSVIMTVYNAERHLAEAIEGVLAQTFGDWELIIINDGSTDRSPEIARGFNDLRIRVEDYPNRGQPISRNTAASISQGEYLAICDSDDVWRPGKLERQVLYLRQHPEVGLVGVQRVAQITEDGEPIAVGVLPTEDEELRRMLWSDVNPFTHSAIVLRRTVFEAIGGYNPRFLYSQDFEMILRAQEHGRLHNLEGEPLVEFRISGAGISQGKRALQLGYKRAALRAAGLRRRGEAVDEEAILAECLPNEAAQGGKASVASDVNFKYAKAAMLWGYPWRATRFLWRSLRERFRPEVVLLLLAVPMIPGPILKWACRCIVRLRRDNMAADPSAP